MCQSTRTRRLSKSISPFLKGVTSATVTPANCSPRVGMGVLRQITWQAYVSRPDYAPNDIVLRARNVNAAFSELYEFCWKDVSLKGNLTGRNFLLKEDRPCGTYLRSLMRRRRRYSLSPGPQHATQKVYVETSVWGMTADNQPRAL